MDLTLAAVLSTAGAVASAALISGLIELLKALPRLGAAIGTARIEPALAFGLSLLLVLAAFAAYGEHSPEGAFAGLLAWYAVARLAMGVHDDVLARA